MIETTPTSLSDIMIELEKVGFSFKDGFFSKKKEVLHSISLTIQEGDAIGVIGRNGMGKSTLLKLLSGVYTPTSGRIKYSDCRVSLLTLNTGLEQNLTGYDNIFLSGSLLGVSQKYIKRNIKDIIEFSGLGDAIYQQVKEYSTGMMSRLSFSVSTILEPDVLLLDEILGVGDLEFQNKSSKFLLDRIAKKQTFLLVSHDLNLIKAICKKVLWLENGNIIQFGDTDKVVEQFIATVNN